MPVTTPSSSTNVLIAGLARVYVTASVPDVAANLATG
jgi:hypothetical protein